MSCNQASLMSVYINRLCCYWLVYQHLSAFYLHWFTFSKCHLMNVWWVGVTNSLVSCFVGALSGFPAQISKLHSRPCPVTRESAGTPRSLLWKRSNPRSRRWPSTFPTTSPTWWVHSHLRPAQSGECVTLALDLCPLCLKPDHHWDILKSTDLMR